ncbi:MAG: hypothetical protein EA358_00175 [Flavobacteriales bacterium]|nr:MAG: hypothetical protein EA358_00175 [Flavobacteriales bacterium]
MRTSIFIHRVPMLILVLALFMLTSSFTQAISSQKTLIFRDSDVEVYVEQKVNRSKTEKYMKERQEAAERDNGRFLQSSPANCRVVEVKLVYKNLSKSQLFFRSNYTPGPLNSNCRSVKTNFDKTDINTRFSSRPVRPKGKAVAFKYTRLITGSAPQPASLYRQVGRESLILRRVEPDK